ncbi:hypothetical protein ACFXEL_35510 [Streptomyces sp. NPDC059382]
MITNSAFPAPDCPALVLAPPACGLDPLGHSSTGSHPDREATMPSGGM